MQPHWKAQARAAQMPADRYLAEIVANALERKHRRDVTNLADHLDKAMAADVAPETTAEQMEAAP